MTTNHRYLFTTLGAVSVAGLLACAPGPAASSSHPATASPDDGVVNVPTSPANSHAYLSRLPRIYPEAGGYDPPPACPAALSLGAGDALAPAPGDNQLGLSVTSDELSAAWVTEHFGEVTIHYVDRASAASPFDVAREVKGAFGTGRIALMSNGLGLAVVDADGLGFSILRRAARADAFGDPEVGPFDQLAAQGRDVLGPAGEHYENPLFANGDRYFLFSRVSPSGAASVQLGSRFFDNDSFPPGVPFAEEALAPAGSKSKVLTGTSVDVRTLFVWDSALSKSVVVRLSARGAIESSADLGSARDVQPTADCHVFWFTSGSPSEVRRFAAP